MAKSIPRKPDLSLAALKATDNPTGKEHHMAHGHRLILIQKSLVLM